jgi:hypothetical protein
MTRSRDNHTIVWRGIVIEIRYEEQWLGSDGPFSTAHLELHVLSPDKAPLPVTETGYRSHFIAAETVTDGGGPVVFVQAWLDHEAKTEAWKEKEAAARQMTLF